MTDASPSPAHQAPSAAVHALISDAAQRPVHTAEVVLSGLSSHSAHVMPEGRANSIAWLVWHAARQMDVQTSALSGDETVWVSGGWTSTLGVERGADDFGFGDTPADVAAFQVRDVAALKDLLQACVDALIEYVTSLSVEELEEVIDTSYTPPVTRSVRLVSIIDDAAVHLGQAAYARGIIDSWSYGV